MSKDEKMALKAVQRLHDEVELGHAACEMLFHSVQEEAIRRLTDEAILREVAEICASTVISKAAIGKIRDNQCLYELATTCKNDFTRRYAVRKITDEALLALIAKKDGRTIETFNASVQTEAVEQIADPELLLEVARTAGLSDVVLTAFRKLAEVNKLDLGWSMNRQKHLGYGNTAALKT